MRNGVEKICLYGLVSTSMVIPNDTNCSSGFLGWRLACRRGGTGSLVLSHPVCIPNATLLNGYVHILSFFLISKHLFLVMLNSILCL